MYTTSLRILSRLIGWHSLPFIQTHINIPTRRTWSPVTNMSLLRSVLKKNGEKTSEQVEGSGAPAPGPSFDPGALGTTSKRSSARSIAASSIRSASAASFKSVATTIASMVSFYSMLTGGSKIPKRRRPDILKFGAPPFVFRRPPPAQPVPGAERLPPLLSPFTAAHSVGEYLNTSGAEPRLCIVLFSHARVPEKKALYHDQAVVAGEIRMFLKKPRALDFIDVWVSHRQVKPFLVRSSCGDSSSSKQEWTVTLRSKELPSFSRKLACIRLGLYLLMTKKPTLKSPG